MPKDQPANPRIRTKVLKLESAIDEALFAILEKLRLGRIEVAEYQRRTMEMLEAFELSKTFAAQIEVARNQDEQNWLVRRHVDECRYTLLFFKVDENEIHPPHQHNNLISTQVVIEGRIHLREYERAGRDDNGRLNLRLVRDARLGPGEVFQASEWRRNVHWFGAIDGPAVLLNINARGYERTTFAQDNPEVFGRRYLDPREFGADGLITCEEIDEAECERRFQGRRLEEFNAPLSTELTDSEMIIRI